MPTFRLNSRARTSAHAGKLQTRRSLAGLAIVLAIASSAACMAVEPLADVPFIPGTIQPFVAISIGKHDNIACIVDTGSSIGVVNSELSRGAHTLGTTMVILANTTRRMPMVQLRDVAIGNARVKFVEAMRRDTSWFDPRAKAPCVLGGSFLDKFTVDIDFDAGRLRLFPRGTRLADVVGDRFANSSLLKGNVGSGRLIVEASVGDVTVKTFIDTGWIITAANESLLEALGIEPDGPQVETGTSATGKTSRWTHIGPVRLGELELAHHRVDFGEFNAMVAGKKFGPFMHVGPVFLAGYRLLIDRKHNQAALIRGAGHREPTHQGN